MNDAKQKKIALSPGLNPLLKVISRLNLADDANDFIHLTDEARKSAIGLLVNDLAKKDVTSAESLHDESVYDVSDEIVDFTLKSEENRRQLMIVIRNKVHELTKQDAALINLCGYLRDAQSEVSADNQAIDMDLITLESYRYIKEHQLVPIKELSEESENTDGAQGRDRVTASRVVKESTWQTTYEDITFIIEGNNIVGVEKGSHVDEKEVEDMPMFLYGAPASRRR